MPRFYIEPGLVKDREIVLSESESHHAIFVLRLKKGDQVDLLDGNGKIFQGIVLGSRDKRVRVGVEKILEVPLPLPFQLTLAISVIKPERMEILIEKACELGVFAIAPILTSRSIVKLSRERWETKLERWREIVKASCKQCALAWTPKIEPVREYKTFITTWASYDKILLPTLAVKGPRLSEVLEGPTPQRILALIGPEGDFAKEEIDKALLQGAKPLDLGPLVMRSETAGIYLLSVLSFFYREMR